MSLENKPLVAGSKSPLRTIKLKGTNESLFFQTQVGIWIQEHLSRYFRCGYPINLEQVKDGIKQFNQEFLENAPKLDSEKDTELYGASTIYELLPQVEQDGTLVLQATSKVIQDIQVLSRCKDHGEARLITEVRGTLPIRGQKPDTLVLQALKFAPGDRYPNHTEQDKALGRVSALKLFRSITFVITPGRDPSKINLLICVAQKKEADLLLEEADLIDPKASVDAAKGAILKYQEALSLFQATKTSPPKINSIPTQKTRIVILALPRGSFIQRQFDFETDAWFGIAAAYTSMGESYQALHYYTQILAKVPTAGRKDGKLAALTAIADIYNTLGDQQQAQQYYEKALTIRLEALRSKGKKPE